MKRPSRGLLASFGGESSRPRNGKKPFVVQSIEGRRALAGRPIYGGGGRAGAWRLFVRGNLLFVCRFVFGEGLVAVVFVLSVLSGRCGGR